MGPAALLRPCSVAAGRQGPFLPQRQRRHADGLRPGPQGHDVLLVSHDGDFLADIEALLDTDRRVGVVAFTEFRNAGFTALESRGVQTFDLEYAVGAFNTRLPRLRVIPIEEFDPAAYL